jgi:hypothetical protein
MYAFKECSPPPILESIQPIENVHLSNTSTTENSRRQNPTAEEFLSEFNDADAMIISGEKEIFYNDKYQLPLIL